jgi:hypothetical protein
VRDVSLQGRIAGPRRDGGIFRFNLQTAWGYGSAFSRHEMPEFCLSFHPLSKQRAQGKPGADCTHGSRATKSTGVGPQVQPESLRLSPRNGLRLTSRSPR